MIKIEFQVIDIRHVFNIEYEWFIRISRKVTRIQIIYVHEANNEIRIFVILQVINNIIKK